VPRRFNFTLGTGTSLNIPIPGVDAADAQYAISITGLPGTVRYPNYANVLNRELNLEFSIADSAVIGAHEFIITLYNEDGVVVFVSDKFVLNIIAPSDPTPVIPIYPQPEFVQLRFLIGEATYTRNGATVTDPEGLVPFIDPAYDRTMVPLRIIAEALDAKVSWVEETRTVVIAKDADVLQLPIDAPLPNNMGMPTIVNDRTFVPLAYISIKLRAQVRWDGDAKAVYVTAQRSINQR